MKPYKEIDCPRVRYEQPLTQTARIRQDIQAIFKDDMRYKFYMARLIPKNEQEYARLRMAFSGGNTHAKMNINNSIQKLQKIANRKVLFDQDYEKRENDFNDLIIKAVKGELEDETL